MLRLSNTPAEGAQPINANRTTLMIAVFPLHVKKKWRVPLDGIRWGCCWEEGDGTWARRRWQCPVAYGKPILLIPKGFVGRNYHLGTVSFIQQQLLAYLQREHLINRSPLCHQRPLKDGSVKFTPPIKKELRRTDLAGVPGKQAAASFACKHPDSLPRFNASRMDRFIETDFSLSDHDLDILLYPDRFQTG